MDDVEVPVTIGNDNHTHSDTLLKGFCIMYMKR